MLTLCSLTVLAQTAPVFAWPHWFWILCIVFPGRNDACVWPHSLTKWVSGMHGLTENSPNPPGKIRVVFQFWWSGALCWALEEQINVVYVVGDMLLTWCVYLHDFFTLCFFWSAASTPHLTVWLQTEWSPRLLSRPTCIHPSHPTRWDISLYLLFKLISLFAILSF